MLPFFEVPLFNHLVVLPINPSETSETSSSGVSLMTHGKSHWGNTGLGGTTLNPRTPGTTLAPADKTKTPGAGDATARNHKEVTCSSGYMADSRYTRSGAGGKSILFKCCESTMKSYHSHPNSSPIRS